MNLLFCVVGLLAQVFFRFLRSGRQRKPLANSPSLSGRTAADKVLVAVFLFLCVKLLVFLEGEYLF